MTTNNQEFNTFYHRFNPANDALETALQNCQDEGFRATYMPELAEARINGKASWKLGFNTASIKATGKTKQGNAVIVYAHVPTTLVTPQGIRLAKAQGEELEGVVHGAALFSQKEFQSLVNRDEKTDAQGNRLIWVVDCEKIESDLQYGDLHVDKALKSQIVIASLGGEKKAERYLLEHVKAYKIKKIGIWHVDDSERGIESPLARLLNMGGHERTQVLGNPSGPYTHETKGDISGCDIDEEEICRFLGIRNNRKHEITK